MTFKDFIADPARPCAVVAHRGAWQNDGPGAPENSLAALERAIALGCAIVEVDIQQSADGDLFLLHDDTLQRMAGVDARADTLTLAELQRLRLRRGDGGPDRVMTAETIPSFDAVLETARGRVFLDLDVKHPAQMPAVAARVKAMGMQDQVDLKERIDSTAARAWLQAQPGLDGIPFMGKALFRGAAADATAAEVIALRPFMCEAEFDRLETLAAQAERLRAAGIALWVNTLDSVSSAGFTDTAARADPDAVWGRLIAAGVSVIQTDAVEELLGYVGRENLEIVEWSR
ncbi:glycerophosphodiester phosphodiesterase family protein [Dongia sedimenti]|uniref:Glycerophosphodiester phosphodiesterase family protein n=1 Tax=Dongia sedimenti TaxID=3064282 RepID=A0ABU0YM29_9PROT|nr:glycerophosphodiester phosphodiesterase family protein [Rhodospirillaceae bacterium R-7]